MKSSLRPAGKPRRVLRMLKWFLKIGVLLVLLVVLVLGRTVGCMLLTPLPQRSTVAQRVEEFPTRDVPIRHPAVVRWDQHMIPFIEAQNDEDLAFVLGMVHAHLRLGQMELARHLARGRVAEVFGPPMVEVDKAIRILDPGKAADEIYESLPQPTRRWLDEFVRGVNYYQDNLSELPHEFKVMGIEREHWRPQDVIAISRLAAADFAWMTWFTLLQLKDDPHYEEVLDRFIMIGGRSLPSFTAPGEGAEVLDMLSAGARWGSNSFAVGRARSATGGAILANDPHLGVMVPNIWLIVGYRSPTRHSVGLMFAGLPVMAIGRTEHIAWGGTNMRAAVSDLYDVSHEPPDALTRHQEKIGVRWWFDGEAELRESPYGPVVSDIPFLSGIGGPEFALRWLGHRASDEFTPLLDAEQARSWGEFREAFRDYAVPGMNILYADAEGNIGQLLAATIPVRGSPLPTPLIRDPREPQQAWQGFLGPLDLPFAYNPEQGFLVSCNNSPVTTNPPVGYFFAPNDRFLRITGLLSALGPVSIDMAKEIQRDVYALTDVKLRDLVIEKLDAAGLREKIASEHGKLLSNLVGWDGRYAPDSAGAVAFQAVLYHFASGFYSKRYGPSAGELLVSASYAREFLVDDLQASKAKDVAGLLEEAFAAAQPAVEQYGTWGEMHRLSLSHPFSGLPLTGDKYVFADLPSAGSNETVYKAAHGLSADESLVRYGSDARCVCDLSDPDENYFVLLGGQDGRLRSEASLDQVVLWTSGQYVKVPLLLETVNTEFEHVLEILPAPAAGAED